MNTERFATARSAPLPPTQISPEASPEEVDLASLARTLWRGKWKIVFWMLICGVLAVFWLINIAVPQYTAMSVVALENRNEQVTELDSVLSGLSAHPNTVFTEAEVLKARLLARKVVEKLNLTADPEFNHHIREKKSLLPESVGNIIKAVFGSGSEDGEKAPPPSDRQVMDDTIDAFLRRLAVSNIQRSLVFELRITTEDAEKSALIADTLADRYVQDQVDVKLDANARATEWLNGRVIGLEAELEEAENSVKDFRASSDVISEDALALRSRQLKDFRTRRGDLLAEQNAFETRIAELQQARATGPKAMALAADDPGLTALEGRLNGGGAGAREAFNARFAAVVQRAELERTRRIEQLAAIDGSIAELNTEVAKQSSELLELRQLEREAGATRQIYEYFLGRLKETSIQQGFRSADSRILSPAVVPATPSSPKSLLSILMALIIGLILGVASVLLRELRSKTFRIPEELEAQTGLTVIGEITRAKSSRRSHLLKDIASQSNSALTEAVRNLRTSIMLSSISGPPQVIMMTSSVPAEGKTTLSLALAHSMQSMNKKVLLIEGDIRRRTFREYFTPMGGTRGLMSVVAGESFLEDAVHYSNQLGVDVLMGEGTKVNATDFFSSDAFRQFLDVARKSYDFIIIDTPPVLAVPDARVIGPMVDVVLYIVHWDRTTKRQVRQGLHAFATVNVPVNGLVLSQINQTRQKSYGYGDGYGTYAKGYYQ
ncbi:MAG: polysaccharide biosynthesis tyrosine autokinase [Pseudomonadota bacterium]